MQPWIFFSKSNGFLRTEKITVEMMFVCVGLGLPPILISKPYCVGNMSGVQNLNKKPVQCVFGPGLLPIIACTPKHRSQTVMGILWVSSLRPPPLVPLFIKW